MAERREFPNGPAALSGKSGYRLLTSLHTGIPPAEESAIAVGSSPYTFTAPRKGIAIVQGGTVNMIQWSRTTANYNTGQTVGVFPLAAGDSLIITHTGAPNFTFAPT